MEQRAAERDAVARYRCSRRDDGVWQDRRRCVADCPARREHAGSRASTPTARPMDRATFDLPRPAGEVDWSYRRGADPCRTDSSTSPHSELVKKGIVDDRVADYGHVIVDECHHLSAHSFEPVARQAKARFVLGTVGDRRAQGRASPDHLSCSAGRCGTASTRGRRQLPVHSSTSSWCNRRTFHSARSPDADKRLEFQALYQELVDDATRNRRIADDVIEAVKNGRSPTCSTRWTQSSCAPTPKRATSPRSASRRRWDSLSCSASTNARTSRPGTSCGWSAAVHPNLGKRHGRGSAKGLRRGGRADGPRGRAVGPMCGGHAAAHDGPPL